MNPWQALLLSLQSALIDVLTQGMTGEEADEHKPILGLPQKISTFPVGSVLGERVTLRDQEGCYGIEFSSDFKPNEQKTILEDLKKLAVSEFKHHQIEPLFKPFEQAPALSVAIVYPMEHRSRSLRLFVGILK
jgi:hypothetical protein